MSARDAPRGLRIRYPEGRAQPAAASSGLLVELPARAVEPVREALRNRLFHGASLLLQLEDMDVQLQPASIGVTDVRWQGGKVTVSVTAVDLTRWIDALADPDLDGPVTLPSEGLALVRVRFVTEEQRRAEDRVEGYVPPPRRQARARERAVRPRRREPAFVGRPKVIPWFKAYCILMGIYFVSGCGFGSLFVIFDDEFARSQGDTPEASVAVGLFYIVIGAIVSIPHWVGPFLPRAKWVWIYGIIVIAFGNLACVLCVPIGIPMMVFWVMPENRAWHFDDRRTDDQDHRQLERIFD